VAEDTDEAASDSAGLKRKREPDEVDLREEIKRVKKENEELRRQVEAQNRQTVAMMQQITQLQEALQLQNPRMAASSPLL
jgi:hypothetical protein